MSLTVRTRTKIVEEGITTVDGLADCDKDSVKQVLENLRRQSVCVIDPNPNANAGATIPIPPFIFRAKL